jgi:hypothetical protein
MRQAEGGKSGLNLPKKPFKRGLILRFFLKKVVN